MGKVGNAKIFFQEKNAIFLNIGGGYKKQDLNREHTIFPSICRGKKAKMILKFFILTGKNTDWSLI